MRSEIIKQKNSVPNAEQISQSSLELVPESQPKPEPAHSPQGLPHAFVVMPFGKKKGPDEGWIDFNSIYHDLIKPALMEAGFEPFRADEETVSGDILTDMFQELLLADLVIADLSIDNANVKFTLLSTLESLRLSESLNFRPEYVKAGIDVLQSELNRIERQEEAVADPEQAENPPPKFSSSQVI